MRRRHSAANERGAAAVEMALVLPLLLLIVFGIIDFGRMLNAQIAVTEAARQGARVYVLTQPPGSAVAAARTQAVTSAAGLGLAGDDVTITECTEARPEARVSVAYEFKFVTPVSLLAGGLYEGTIDGTAVMRCAQ